MSYDSKGILVFNLKYEHAISFINWQFGQIHYQMSRSISSKLFVIACTDHRIIEILGLRPSNRLPVSYYFIESTVFSFMRWNMTWHIFWRHWRMTSKVRKRTSRNTKKGKIKDTNIFNTVGVCIWKKPQWLNP
jgi:hypothetical protein